tara:strand:- start:5114 stop:5815 length:702 start_codon:yes stop_codon:yes gene_type:complete
MKTENKQHELSIPEYTQLIAWLEKKVGKDRPTGWSALVYAQYLISQNPTEWWTKYEKHLANSFRLKNGSYWNNNGKYQDFLDKVEKLVPARDAVMKYLPYSLEPKQSFKPLLECFRVYSNIYYDLYNNGGTNMYDRREEENELYEGEYYWEYYWRDDTDEEVVYHIDKYLNLPKSKSLKYNYEEEVKTYYDGGKSAVNRYYIERVGDLLLEKLQEAYKSENAHLLERLEGVEA